MKSKERKKKLEKEKVREFTRLCFFWYLYRVAVLSKIYFVLSWALFSYHFLEFYNMERGIFRI